MKLVKSPQRQKVTSNSLKINQKSPTLLTCFDEVKKFKFIYAAKLVGWLVVLERWSALEEKRIDELRKSTETEEEKSLESRKGMK